VGGTIPEIVVLSEDPRTTPHSEEETQMNHMTGRNVLIGFFVVAILTAAASCGGGGGSSSVGATTYTVGGTITGLVGNATLRLNSVNDITISTSGPFTFPLGLIYLANYSVTASAAQNCNVVNGAGVVGTANITNVTITCTTVVRSASLSGAQENPPNSSTATGRGAVIVNPTTREITGGITFSGLVASSGGHHIHQAPAGLPTQNGGVIVALTLAPDGLTATVPSGTFLSPAQYTALLAGELYFNVHSNNNNCPPAPTCAAGEIRGRINVQGGVIAGLASLNGAQEGSGNTSTATGRGTIVFDSTTRQVLISYVTHNVTNSTAAHIHTGAPGVSGPPDVVGLLQGTNIYTAPNPTILTVQNVTDLNAGNTYFNIHSTNSNCPPATDCAAGEIRGQIAVQ
jgi:CHRD domain